jgi:hypothetical protein
MAVPLLIITCGPDRFSALLREEKLVHEAVTLRPLLPIVRYIPPFMIWLHKTYLLYRVNPWRAIDQSVGWLAGWLGTGLSKRCLIPVKR